MTQRSETEKQISIPFMISCCIVCKNTNRTSLATNTIDRVTAATDVETSASLIAISAAPAGRSVNGPHTSSIQSEEGLDIACTSAAAEWWIGFGALLSPFRSSAVETTRSTFATRHTEEFLNCTAARARSVAGERAAKATQYLWTTACGLQRSVLPGCASPVRHAGIHICIERACIWMSVQVTSRRSKRQREIRWNRQDTEETPAHAHSSYCGNTYLGLAGHHALHEPAGCSFYSHDGPALYNHFRSTHRRSCWGVPGTGSS